MTDTPRLIERAFPLKQASLDSVHEKNVRHGHISTLHIWPARRPLAACRAALIATLLTDPGTPEERRLLCEKIGGRVVEKAERKLMPNGQVVERVREVTEGGILHWKRETENAEDLEWFRHEIRKAYGGRAPKVLDPFAGGGAIPLEAMRLGCEATAMDINPVSWFILKCTLEYPQKLAGKTHPLPEFILEDEEYMEAFYKAHPHLVGRTKKTKNQKMKEEAEPSFFDKEDSGRIPKADLAWHVRAWGRWVLNQARKELAEYYPVYADFEPMDLKNPKKYEPRPMEPVPLKEDGTPDIDKLNSEFSQEYIQDKRNPRWVSKPTVAYLWARTVTCKNCRATLPLLKTRWLCKKAKKRVLLTMTPKADQSGVEFGIQNNVSVTGGNAAQKREHDKRLGEGTMSQAGAKCPCCGTIMTMVDLRAEGKSHRLNVVLMGVVTDGQMGKEYRIARDCDHGIIPDAVLDGATGRLPFGLPYETIPNNPRRFATPIYGMRTFGSLFTNRQQLALSIFGNIIRDVYHNNIEETSYNDEWRKAVYAFLVLIQDRLADYSSAVCTWHNSGEKIRNTFARFALPMVWDYCEVNLISNTSGNFLGALEWEARVCEYLGSITSTIPPMVNRYSATKGDNCKYDIIVTDPPYYDAIPYSDISNFFYVWQRRMIGDLFPEHFADEIIPYTGEIVMDRKHATLEKPRTKEYYEDEMAKAFRQANNALVEDGRFVVVFAHKEPKAWETLASAMIQAGFIVDASWPIQTEMGTRSNARGTAALASSIWLVCKKRPISARPGWDNQVLEEMRANIKECLHEYWDAGIRGPDFVWAATGPALEAYSKHPVVKKANSPGEIMSVGEFLSHVRRMVVDFVVGRVLTGAEEGADLAAADRMDAPTAYYLLHRHDFGMDEAPAGACILYATACGLSDRELEVNWDILTHTGGNTPGNMDDDEIEKDAEEDGGGSDSGSKVKLKAWTQRKSNSLGYEAPSGRPIPLIDRIHCLMHLWKAGDVHKVDEYLDDNGLRRHELFKRLLQSLIELSQSGGNERSLLESLSNHIGAKGAVRDTRQVVLSYGENT